jgi:hypothetical protein
VQEKERGHYKGDAAGVLLLPVFSLSFLKEAAEGAPFILRSLPGA